MKNYEESLNELRALYLQFFPERKDEGLTFTILDLLHQERKARNFGIEKNKLAEIWGVPIHFVEAIERHNTLYPDALNPN